MKTDEDARRDAEDEAAEDQPRTSRDTARSARTPRAGRRLRFGKALRFTATAVILILAALAAATVWQFYVTAPWTRDGRVRLSFFPSSLRIPQYQSGGST